MTSEERLGRVLSLMFRRIKVNERAKEDLQRKLFGGWALNDDELDFVAAAGDLTEQEREKTNDKTNKDE